MLCIAKGFGESWLDPQHWGVLEGQCWGGVGREGTFKWDPLEWAHAGLEQTARQLSHVNIHLTSLGVRGVQLQLSKAKGRQVFVTVGPSNCHCNSPYHGKVVGSDSGCGHWVLSRSGGQVQGWSMPILLWEASV